MEPETQPGLVTTRFVWDPSGEHDPDSSWHRSGRAMILLVFFFWCSLHVRNTECMF